MSDEYEKSSITAMCESFDQAATLPGHIVQNQLKSFVVVQWKNNDQIFDHPNPILHNV